MGKIARTVEDVILGEAKAASFEDMVAIASAIANRAAATGTTASNIVSKRSEFNAYGKALPSGVEKHRDLAKEAIDYVNTFGPTHTGQFYATPAAKDNLPDGLRQVAASPGHVFYEDPQGRSINTAVGYRTPEPVQLVGYAPEVGPVPEYRPDLAVDRSIPSYDTLMAYAPVSSTPASIDFTPPSSAIRDLPVQPALTGVVEAAVSRMGPEYGWTTVSGGQPSRGMMGVDRTGSTRHNDGWALDGALTLGGQRLNPVTDYQDYMNLLTNLAEEGVGGLGHYGWGIHADLKTPNAWGPNTKSNTLDAGFKEAIDQGRALSSLNGNYPTPSPRPDIPDPSMVASAPSSRSVSPNLDLMAFDPVKSPDLNYVAPSAPVAAYSDPQKTATPFDTVLNMPEVPAAPTNLAAYTDARVSAPNAGKAPSAPIDKVTEIAAKTPDIPDLANQYASYGAGRQLKEQAAALAMDVAQAKGIAPNFMPTAPAPAIATPAAAPKAPSITDVQPKAPDLPAARNVSNAPQVKTVDSQFSKQPDVPDMATNRAQLAAIAANNKLADAKKDQRTVATIAGTLGGIALGPIGGILGTIIGNQLGKNSYLQQFPEAPPPSSLSDFFGQMFGGAGGGVSYNDLNDFGRQAYNDSQNFRDSIDSGGVGLY